MKRSHDAPIRLLLLTDEMEVGGSQRQIVQIAAALDRARYAPSVAYFRNASFLVGELEASGVRVTCIPKRGRVDPRFVANLTRFLREGRFDAMHCFDFTGELWGAVARRLLPAKARPALLTTVQGTFDWYSPWQWPLKRWVTTQSCRVIANSDAGRAYACKRMGLAEDAIHVVNNGVADPVGAVRVPGARPEADPSALFVGRLVEVKNIPVLLRAMKRLQEGGSRLRLRIAGDGPLRAPLQAQVEAMGLAGSVELLGQRSDVAALMSEATLVVLPSFSEGLSNVILEAMMAGRPVVASAVGGSPELIDPMRTGLLFPSDDDEALAAAVRSLVEDPALAARLGAAARRHALDNYGMGAMVARMEAHYQSCLAGRG